MATLEEEIRMIKKKSLSANTRKKYLYSQVRFINWLDDNEPQALLIRGLGNDRIKEVIGMNETLLDFNQLTPKIFFKWLLTLRKPDGSKPGFRACAGHRSALYNLAKESGTPLSEDFDSELGQFFRGLQRTRVEEKAANGETLEEGKKALVLHFF